MLAMVTIASCHHQDYTLLIFILYLLIPIHGLVILVMIKICIRTSTLMISSYD